MNFGPEQDKTYWMTWGIVVAITTVAIIFGVIVS